MRQLHKQAAGWVRPRVARRRPGASRCSLLALATAAAGKRPTMASLNVTGAPDEGLLHDHALRGRFGVLVAPIAAHLAQTPQPQAGPPPEQPEQPQQPEPQPEPQEQEQEQTQETHVEAAGKTAPTISGSLTSGDLASLAYQLQLFQHRRLGPDAPRRPAHPDATEPGARHPVRIPADLFLTSPASSDPRTPMSPEAPLRFVLQHALAFLQQRGKRGWDDILEDSAVGFYCELIASVRRQLRNSQLLRTPLVAPPSDWTQAQIDHHKTLAQQLEGMCFLSPPSPHL